MQNLVARTMDSTFIFLIMVVLNLAIDVPMAKSLMEEFGMWPKTHLF